MMSNDRLMPLIALLRQSVESDDYARVRTNYQSMLDRHGQERAELVARQRLEALKFETEKGTDYKLWRKARGIAQQIQSELIDMRRATTTAEDELGVIQTYISTLDSLKATIDYFYNEGIAEND